MDLPHRSKCCSIFVGSVPMKNKIYLVCKFINSNLIHGNISLASFHYRHISIWVDLYYLSFHFEKRVEQVNIYIDTSFDHNPYHCLYFCCKCIKKLTTLQTADKRTSAFGKGRIICFAIWWLQ